MPTSCCAPGCRSNYGSSKDNIKVFEFPKDPVRRKKWITAIRRANFTPGPRTVVCIEHFEDRFVVREDRMKRPDGTELVVKRSYVKLTPDAYPTIFKNIPVYITIEVPPRRKDPSKKETKIKEKPEAKKRARERRDIIKDFNDFKMNFRRKCSFAFDSITVSEGKETVSFFKIAYSEPSVPKVCASLSVDSNLNIVAAREGTVVTDNPDVQSICDEGKVERWSTLDCLCSLLFTETEMLLTE